MTEAIQASGPDPADRDRALANLRRITAASGIVSLAVAGLSTAAAAAASQPAAAGLPAAKPVPPGPLTTGQLAALEFSFPWAPQLQPAPAPRAAPGPVTAAPRPPAATAAPPAAAPPPPPPPPVSTGTS